MIEVMPDGNGAWVWRWITAEGRVLIEAGPYPTDWCAITCARDYRVRFWRMSDSIDHRQARCI